MRYHLVRCLEKLTRRLSKIFENLFTKAFEWIDSLSLKGCAECSAVAAGAGDALHEVRERRGTAADSSLLELPPPISEGIAALDVYTALKSKFGNRQCKVAKDLRMQGSMDAHLVYTVQHALLLVEAESTHVLCKSSAAAIWQIGAVCLVCGRTHRTHLKTVSG